MTRRAWSTALLDLGGVLAAFVVLLVVENVVVGLAHKSEFTASWEMAQARSYLSPVALAAFLPFALAAVAVGRLASAGRFRSLAAVAAVSGLALGLGVTTGRHFASWAARGPFVLAVAAVAGVGVLLGAPRVVRLRPSVLASLGVAVAALAWLADVRILPRLYPAFHLGLFAMVCLAWSLGWLALRESPVGAVVSRVGLVLALAAAVFVPRASRAVANSDNLRRVLLEHAPVLGRAVRVAAVVAPPPPLDEGADAALAAAASAGVATRALDWSGRDIVLVTIDALRADHVGAYGYRRPTTPSIDALAARGVRFTHAYCPTPHTSYSVASLMTGKYVKPLLAMGAADDGETWPMYLRRYGYRTAAFYPPAVFFIDEHKFKRMQAEGLGFEYRKEEFAAPALRRAQIERYLTLAPRDKPLFLWVHLFEPHEPYEMHPEHPFAGDPTSDAYDSEIAAADALVGDVERLVHARRPGAVLLVSADHGEELGDHGGRYHGTTVYEEQVRVPLVVVAPGLAPGVVETPVQTIDLLPTVLSALDVPRPSRVRGRDLGPLLAPKAGAAKDEGLAFAETDEQTLVARGTDRLVCARKIGACTLFDVAKDPGEKAPIADRPERVAELRRLTAALERENGKVEASALPEALRRGLQGDRDAAEDVLPLFDDARAEIRRGAARCAFRLRAPEMVPQLKRALVRDEDAEVKAWAAVALVRLGATPDAGAPAAGEPESGLAAKALAEGAPELRVAAALALAETGDARGERVLVERWERAFVPEAPSPGDVDEARALLGALVRLGARSAVPALVRTLEDVRLRPHVVEALGAIGDPRARGPLLEVLRSERFVHMRGPEARALAALGAEREMAVAFREALARFAGVPEPNVEVVAIARDAGLLRPEVGGLALSPARPAASATLRVPGSGAARVLVLAGGSADVGAPRASVDGTPLALAPRGDVWVGELPAVGAEARLELAHDAGVRAAWIVRRAPEIPPPPPRAWDAGASSDEIP